jgi:PAS domain S-box-containing protein
VGRRHIGDGSPRAAGRAGRAGFAAGLLVVGGLAALDASLDADQVISATVVLGVFVAALTASVRETALVAVLALAAVVLSGVWHDNASEFPQFVRVAVVALGGAAGVLGARSRVRSERLLEELAEAELQLSTGFGSMAAAVLIQRPGQGIVYANPAAAEAMGMDSAEAVVAATPEEIAENWETFNEDGSPLLADQYPSRRLLQGHRSAAPLMVRTVNRATGREYWRLVKASPVFDERGRLAMTVSVTEDITEIKRAERTQRLLADAGETLAGARDAAQALEGLVRLVVPHLADWCSVSLPAEDGRIHQVAIAHVDPDKVAFARDYATRFPGHTSDPAGAAAILRGEPPMVISEIPDELLVASVPHPEQLQMLRQIGMRAVMQVPITAPGAGVLGVLNLVHADSRRVFTTPDLALASELGRRVGVSLHNRRLYAERSHIAATLQASLLPGELPAVPGFALASTYRPAGEANWVGGDFYDAFAVAGGWMVIVGDVVGRGVDAAALTAQARHTLRAIGEATGDPAEAVAHLNRLLLARGDLSLCTVCAVLLTEGEHGDATASVVCAGHPLPLLVRDGRAVEAGDWGTTVGAAESTFAATPVTLRAGDLLVLYTDGVLDARAEEEQFGEQRLVDTVAPATGARDAVDRIERALDAFQRGPQADDTAVLAVQRTPVRAASGEQRSAWERVR